MQQATSVLCATCNKPGARVQCTVCCCTVYCNAECQAANAVKHSTVCYAANSTSLDLVEKLFVEGSVAFLGRRNTTALQEIKDSTISDEGVKFVRTVKKVLRDSSWLDEVICALQKNAPHELWMVQTPDQIHTDPDCNALMVRPCPAARKELLENSSVSTAKRAGFIPYVVMSCVPPSVKTVCAKPKVGRFAFYGAVIPRPSSGASVLPDCRHFIDDGLSIIALPEPLHCIVCNIAAEQTHKTGKAPPGSCVRVVTRVPLLMRTCQ